MIDWLFGWITGTALDSGKNRIVKKVKSVIYTDDHRLTNFEIIRNYLVRNIIGKNAGPIFDDELSNILGIDRDEVVKCLKIMKQYRWINYREHLGPGPYELQVLWAIIVDDVEQFSALDRIDMERSIPLIKDFLLTQPGKSALVSDIETGIGQARFITLGALSIMVRDSQARRSENCGLADFKFYLI